jgi:predicted transcriptional regulator
MTVKPVRKLEIVQRRQKVAELYLQGWQQDAIAKELGLRQPMISEDLAKIRQAWRESAIRDFDAARDLELERLNRIEREAWSGWQRSQQPTQSATVDGEAGSQKAKRTVRHQYGDPRFLDIVLRCNEARRKLLGIDAPTKIAPTLPDGQPLTLEERRIHINAIMTEYFGVAALLPGDSEEVHDEGGPAPDAAGEDDG